MADWMPESWDEDYRQVYALLSSTQEEKRWWRRALYHACGGDHAKVAECMKATESTVLNRDGTQRTQAALAEHNSGVMSAGPLKPTEACAFPSQAFCGKPFVARDDAPNYCANMAGPTKCLHPRACHSTQNTKDQEQANGA